MQHYILVAGIAITGAMAFESLGGSVESSVVKRVGSSATHAAGSTVQPATPGLGSTSEAMIFAGAVEAATRAADLAQDVASASRRSAAAQTGQAVEDLVRAHFREPQNASLARERLLAAGIRQSALQSDSDVARTVSDWMARALGPQASRDPLKTTQQLLGQHFQQTYRGFRPDLSPNVMAGFISQTSYKRLVEEVALYRLISDQVLDTILKSDDSRMTIRRAAPVVESIGISVRPSFSVPLRRIGEPVGTATHTMGRKTHRIWDVPSHNLSPDVVSQIGLEPGQKLRLYVPNGQEEINEIAILNRVFTAKKQGLRAYGHWDNH